MWRRVFRAVVPLLFAVVLWAEALYIANGPVTFAWDPSENATTYDVAAVWQGVTGDKQTYLIGSTVETQMVVERPRTGHFEFQVRACAGIECSTWSKSTDPAVATVDGLPRGWRVFFEMTAPSSGGVS